MSENPWKKQADANKPPPVKPPGTGAPPAWMKKADQPATQAPVQTTQPNPSPAQQQPATTNQPPPQPAQQPATTGFKPPGANPAGGWKPGGGAPPGGAKPPGMTAPTNAGNAPAWMKNKQTTSPIQTDRKMQEDKAEE